MTINRRNGKLVLWRTGFWDGYINYKIGNYKIQIGRDAFATTRAGCDICSSDKPTSFAGGRVEGDEWGYITSCKLCTVCSKKYGFFGDDESIIKGLSFLKMKKLI